MFRGKYRLSDMVVIGASRGASDGVFDDANHGTTIEFNGRMPAPFEKVYDDTPGSEDLNDNVGFDHVIVVSVDVADTDGDGIPDLAADGVATATISLDKRDAAGVPQHAVGDNDDFFVEVSAGELDMSSGSLVNGQKDIVLQASTQKGLVVVVAARIKGAPLTEVALRVKFT